MDTLVCPANYLRDLNNVKESWRLDVEYDTTLICIKRLLVLKALVRLIAHLQDNECLALI